MRRPIRSNACNTTSATLECRPGIHEPAGLQIFVCLPFLRINRDRILRLWQEAGRDHTVCGGLDDDCRVLLCQQRAPHVVSQPRADGGSLSAPEARRLRCWSTRNGIFDTVPDGGLVACGYLGGCTGVGVRSGSTRPTLFLSGVFADQVQPCVPASSHPSPDGSQGNFLLEKVGRRHLSRLIPVDQSVT